jgi:phosphatidylglycerophosphate synthase
MNSIGPEPVVRREVKARRFGAVMNFAAWLARRGVRPNTISWLSVLCASAAGVCLAYIPCVSSGGRIGLLAAAVVLVQLRLVCNLLDGLVAVEGGLKTRSGEVFNDLPDRLSDPIILVCAGYATRDMPFGVELGWLAGLLAVMTAYVRTLGGATGAGQFFLGPMAKQHRMAVITCAMVAGAATAKWDGIEASLAAGLCIIVAGCVVTVVRRAARIVRTLEAR